MLKKGVRVEHLAPELVLALLVADGVYTRHGVELMVTSGCEGMHAVKSLHYRGRAVDLRLPVMVSIRQVVAEELRSRLGEDFDVVLESDHIHVEFDPKGGAS